MKSTAALAFALSASILTAGCNSNENLKDDNSAAEVAFRAGSACSAQVQERSKGLFSTTNFTHVNLREGIYITTKDGIQTDEGITGIPYFESSALDNGHAGSAWRMCMTQKGIKV